jgi:hypothetical protein
MEAYHEDARHCLSLGHSYRFPRFRPAREGGTTHQNLRRQSAPRIFECLSKLPVNVLVVKFEQLSRGAAYRFLLNFNHGGERNGKIFRYSTRRRRDGHFGFGSDGSRRQSQS